MKSILTLPLLLLCVLLLPGPRAFAGADEPTYSPKLSFRIGNGMLLNSGTAKGQSLNAIGAINIQYSYFFTPQIAFGLGYSSNPPLTGLSTSGRYYFKGQGTRVREQGPSLLSEHRDNFACYTGFEISQNSYSINSRKDSVATADMISGSSTMVSALLGADLRISRHFEITAEANLAVFPLSTSNNYILLKSYLLNTGVSYVW